MRLHTTLRLFSILFSCLLFSAISVSQSKDVVYLKNGSIIKGIIIEQNLNKTIKLQTSEGNSFVYDFVDIEKITRESNISQGCPIDKGSSLLLGKFGFSSRGGDLYNNSSGDRNTLIQFTPSFGYFIARGLMLGVELNLLMQSQGSYSNTNWSIGPALMYFIGGNDSKSTVRGETYPFLGAGIQFLQVTTKASGNSYSGSGFITYFGGGVCHMISESVGLSGRVKYEIDQVKPENESSVTGNKLDFGVGMIVFFTNLV